jgi:hypothetical protein
LAVTATGFTVVGASPVCGGGAGWLAGSELLGCAALWGGYGLYYFLAGSKAKRKAVLLEPATAAS